MFSEPHEKGHGEWSAFSAVREDQGGMYRVAVPQKPIITRGRGNVLRITNPHQLRGAQ